MPVRGRTSIAIAAAAAGLLTACHGSPAPPAEHVVVVDTDAPVVGQLGDETISDEAAVDALRVDVLDAQGRVAQVRAFVASDASDWPLSFGVIDDGADVRLRLRVFRAREAASGEVGGVPVLEPRAGLAIDRAVTLTTGGARRVRVTLASDCRGVPSSFLAPQATCVDASRRAAAPDVGLEDDPSPGAPARVGSWRFAHATPCSRPAPAGSVCVAGGYSELGDERLTGVSDGLDSLDAVPVRPVVVGPFFLDRTEFTVGRFRPLAGRLTTAMPKGPSANDAFCSYAGGDSHDDLPLTCVTWQTAAELCSLVGGALPTEAQWLHAARGRGQGRTYPWGDTYVGCCNASAGRAGIVTAVNSICPGGTGPEPVGSHPVSASCEDVGDVSRDGVVDLGGSVAEWLADRSARYDDPCWGGPGVLINPRCAPAQGVDYASGGGAWSEGTALLVSAWRRPGVAESSRGFRCAYAGGAR